MKLIHMFRITSGFLLVPRGQIVHVDSCDDELVVYIEYDKANLRDTKKRYFELYSTGYDIHPDAIYLGCIKLNGYLKFVYETTNC